MTFPFPPDAIVKDDTQLTDDFQAPFVTWVEVNGKVIKESTMKAGADSHVSMHNIFAIKISEKNVTVNFK